MDEHDSYPCSPHCVCEGVVGKSLTLEEILQVRNRGLINFDHLIRGDILGHLCGQLEPHGHLITSNHEYVMIDNECMFHNGPCLNRYSWLNEPAVQPVILDVCNRLVSLSEDELGVISAIPNGYAVSGARDLFKAVCAAKSAAAEYLELFGDEH